MEALEKRILTEGEIRPGGILKVDGFLNHRIDPRLSYEMAEELKRLYEGSEINKILTIEASGIAPAIMLGYLMELPVVFVKKKVPSTMSDFYQTEVCSFTKHRSYNVVINKEYLTSDDHVLFIDDFLAFGNAGKGIIDLCRQAGATIEGMGFIIEKGFQHGREVLQKEGIRRIESMAIIESLDNCQIKIKEDE